jgi:hypothetical protein
LLPYSLKVPVISRLGLFSQDWAFNLVLGDAMHVTHEDKSGVQSTVLLYVHAARMFFLVLFKTDLDANIQALSCFLPCVCTVKKVCARCSMYTI